jgi:hypothetical protein
MREKRAIYAGWTFGGRDRPKGSRTRARALLDAMADGDLQAIVEKIVAKAKDGEVAAARSRLKADAVRR